MGFAFAPLYVKPPRHPVPRTARLFSRSSGRQADRVHPPDLFPHGFAPQAFCRRKTATWAPPLLPYTASRRAIRFLGRENERRLVFFREHRRAANVHSEQEEPQIPSSRVRQRAVHVPFQQRGVHRVAPDADRRGIHALQKLQSIAPRYPRSYASDLTLRPRGASTSVGLALEQPARPFHQISEKSKIVLA